MNDRPTPETDELMSFREGFGATNYEWACHSRRLERERDEAREDCKAIAEKLDGIKRLCDKIEEKADWFREKAGQHLDERDEARKTAERYRLAANAMMLQRDKWAAMCGRRK